MSDCARVCLKLVVMQCVSFDFRYNGASLAERPTQYVTVYYKAYNFYAVLSMRSVKLFVAYFDCRYVGLTQIMSVLKRFKVSVRLSGKRVNCDKTERNLSRFLYHTNDHLAQFSDKKNGW